LSPVEEKSWGRREAPSCRKTSIAARELKVTRVANTTGADGMIGLRPMRGLASLSCEH
jgi:hypothetical protein